MPKRKLSPADKKVIRATIKDALAKGVAVIDLVNTLSKKYGVVPETIRYYIKGVKSGKPVRGPGRPKGSGTKAAAPGAPGRPKGRGPGRPPRAAAPASNLYFLDARTAQIVLRHGTRETNIANVVYQDEGRLVTTILKALAGVAR